MIVPEYPHHIFQRGHNGEAVFKDDEGRLKYLADLRELKTQLNVQVYAWCLLPRQVHLLVNPGSNPEMLSEMMKALSARTTRYRNRKGRRSGTLWQSRYRSSVVQRGTWTLACLRYLEKKPVLLNLVNNPAHFSWTSFAMRMSQQTPTWLEHPKEFLALGDTEQKRRDCYGTFVNHPIDDKEKNFIFNAVMRNQLTGSERFNDQIEKLTGVRVSVRGRGRPRRKPRP